MIMIAAPTGLAEKEYDACLNRLLSWLEFEFEFSQWRAVGGACAIQIEDMFPDTIFACFPLEEKPKETEWSFFYLGRPVNHPQALATLQALAEEHVWQRTGSQQPGPLRPTTLPAISQACWLKTTLTWTPQPR
jgi:hypothetical protein